MFKVFSVFDIHKLESAKEVSTPESTIVETTYISYKDDNQAGTTSELMNTGEYMNVFSNHRAAGNVTLNLVNSNNVATGETAQRTDVLYWHYESISTSGDNSWALPDDIISEGMYSKSPDYKGDIILTLTANTRYVLTALVKTVSTNVTGTQVIVNGVTKTIVNQDATPAETVEFDFTTDGTGVVNFNFIQDSNNYGAMNGFKLERYG